MNTILTDDELPPLQPQDHPEPHSFAWTEQEIRAIRARDRLVEAAVLAKLREQEPVAWMRGGWGPDCGPYVEIYRDDEMGWRDRKEWTPLYAAPLPAVVQVPQDLVALLDDVIDHAWNDGVLRKDKPMDDRTLSARQKLLDALAAAPEAPATAVVQVPHGWKLVPVEPTRSMMAAAVIYANGNAVYKNVAAKALEIEESIYGEAYAAMLAAAPEAPAQGSGWLPLTAEEQNRLDGLLKHARWLMQSMPATDGLQHSWALNARQAMQRMHDWLKTYLPPAMPSTTARARDKT